MVTEVPASPEAGFKEVMVIGVTVKLKLLPGKPPTVATTGPVVAPAGTSTVAPVSIQVWMVAGVPLNVTVSPGAKVPKLVPGIEMESPTVPEFGKTFVMVGATVKGAALLGIPFTKTTTFPLNAPAGTSTVILVGLQLVGVACVLLKLMMLVPCDAPKFVPVIVTDAPTGAPPGLIFAILGVGRTVNAKPLLAAPDTVTTTFPVVAPLGTRTAMLVLLQLVGVAAVPLKVTVLVPWVAPKLVPVIVTT